MQSTKPVTRTRVLLTWVLMIVAVCGITTLFFLNGYHSPPPSADDADDTGAPHVGPLFHLIFFLVLGFMALAGAIAVYTVLYATCNFTFNFKQPAWNAMKAKSYILNIIVTVGLSLGIGFIVAAIASPTLRSLGLSPGMADMGPLLVALIGVQFVQLWVLIWSPVERRFIHKRLAAQGITAEQLRGAVLVGLSNPASGLGKRFAAIEEDMGALWVSPEALAFRGDVESFDLTRDQVVDAERRGDNRSVTMLAGIAHVVLHVRQPDGGIRQIRLHTEGCWTMGEKKRAMNALAETIEQWRQQGQVAVS
jgi:hypothetical protein